MQLVGEEAVIWIHVDELERAKHPHAVPCRSSLKAESSFNTYYAQRDKRNHN